MQVLDRSLRQSVTLPPTVAREVKRIAKASSVSTSRVITDLVKTGLAAQEHEKQRFHVLVDQLAASKNQAERKRIKDELARMTFGE
jgi:metal-responsive CopG/Arc/MetJ family transcriptional regulator